MINMYITVPTRTSTAVSDLKVDAINRRALVTFKDTGATYEYENVSARAILQVLFSPDVSLGFWVNNNCINVDRTRDLGPVLPEFI